MSGFAADLRAAGAGLRSRVRYWLSMVRRTTPGPVLVRLVAGSAALGSLLVAAPASVLSSAKVVLFLPVALGVGLFPRTRWVSVAALITIVEWLVATIGLGTSVELARLAALMVGLYLMHSAAALAAVLPYDCVVTPGMVARWARRVVVVLGASLVVGLGGMAVADQLVATPTLLGPVAGALVAAALAGLLAWQLRRTGLTRTGRG
jgi:hypothetical protein